MQVGDRVRTPLGDGVIVGQWPSGSFVVRLNRMVWVEDFTDETVGAFIIQAVFTAGLLKVNPEDYVEQGIREIKVIFQGEI